MRSSTPSQGTAPAGVAPPPGLSAQLAGSIGRLLVRVASNPVVAISVLLVGIASSFVAAPRQGYDAIYPYLLAHAIRDGAPIYDPAWRLAHATALTGLQAPQEGIFY